MRNRDRYATILGKLRIVVKIILTLILTLFSMGAF